MVGFPSMLNNRYLVHEVLPHILGGMAIAVGLVILVFTEVIDTRFALEGLIGVPLVVVGAIILITANRIRRKRRGL